MSHFTCFIEISPDIVCPSDSRDVEQTLRPLSSVVFAVCTGEGVNGTRTSQKLRHAIIKNEKGGGHVVASLTLGAVFPCGLHR